MKELVCMYCGSDKILVAVWVDANTNEYKYECDSIEPWCENCAEHTTLVTFEKYVKLQS